MNVLLILGFVMAWFAMSWAARPLVPSASR